MTQLIITAIGVAISVKIDGFKDFFNNNMAIYIICVVLYVVSVIMLGCYRSVARKVPLNYSLLFLLTICMTYMT